MTEAPPDEPQAPRAVCPLQTCEWSIPYPPSGDIEELRPELKAHGETHTAEEFLNTIGMLQSALWERDTEINDLTSALRGANFLMQQAGLAPKSPFQTEAEQPIVPPSGLLIPDHIARERSGQPQHRTGEAKHGDVVPGKGKLVGKKITDPMVLKDLKKGKDEHGH